MIASFGPRNLRRRFAAVLGAAALVTTAGLVVPTAAHADDSSTLTVVGTSDVQDSGLMDNIIKKDFQAAYPSVTLNYVSKGTQAAINYAEAGTASALLVHAASLENQFVQAGYSLEPAGRALFYGDFVILGPASDPAHVLTDAPHDAATAFEKIAAAGANNDATFVTRNDGSGTNVQEHKIWSLTTNVQTCTVSDANGGFTEPSNVTGPCPSTPNFPSWYQPGAKTQAANVEAADACNFPNGNCYTITDRGTYENLVMQDEVSNLQVVTQDNDSSARGGYPLLLNSFHAYALNPKAFTDPNVQINTTAATNFLNFVQSPAEQARIAGYLVNDGRPAFIPDAAPQVNVTPFPTSVTSPGSVTIGGKILNVVPETPALADETVNLQSAPTRTPDAPLTTIATTTTHDDGTFSFTYRPYQNRRFVVSVPSITQTEDNTLNPPFKDILAATTDDAGTTDVVAAVTGVSAASNHTALLAVSGHLSPTVAGDAAQILLYARPQGSTGSYAYKGLHALTAGQSFFSYKFGLASGKWQIKMIYQNTGYLDKGASTPKNVTVR